MGGFARFYETCTSYAQPSPRPFSASSSSALGQDATFSYQLAPEWPIQARTAAGTPAGPWNFIQVPGVAITASGNVLVLHRGAHPIMEFERSGKFIRSWGTGLISEERL